jgi:hypothetical protein
LSRSTQENDLSDKKEEKGKVKKEEKGKVKN